MKLFFVTALLVTVVGLSGCVEYQKPAWEVAPLTHVCTSEQMIKVEKEAKWCSTNTGYLSSYCYGSAIIRNCTPKGAQ